MLVIRSLDPLAISGKSVLRQLPSVVHAAKSRVTRFWPSKRSNMEVAAEIVESVVRNAVGKHPTMVGAKRGAGEIFTEGSKPAGEEKRPRVDASGAEAEAEADEEEGEEEVLDLLAIRKFEYEQVAKFAPAQLKRYEQYRRSDLKKEKVKKVLAALNPALAKASDHYLIAVKGLAKVFVGDVVEAALEVRQTCGEKGPLTPKHLREAYRRLRRDGAMPSVDFDERGGIGSGGL